MNIYVVSYDLNKPGKDYEKLFGELKKSPTWWHYLDSTWLIHTNETAEQLYNRLASTLDKNDHILVIVAGQDRQGWLPKKAWEWFTEIGH